MINPKEMELHGVYQDEEYNYFQVKPDHRVYFPAMEDWYVNEFLPHYHDLFMTNKPFVPHDWYQWYKKVYFNINTHAKGTPANKLMVQWWKRAVFYTIDKYRNDPGDWTPEIKQTLLELAWNFRYQPDEVIKIK